MVKIGLIAGMSMLAASSFHWQDRAPLPAPLAGGYALAYDGGVLYAGGTTWQNGLKSYSRDVEYYDPRANRWTRGPSLPSAAAYGAAVGTSHGPEIFGGTDGERMSRESWHLDPATRMWRTSGQLPIDPLLSRAESIGDEVFLFGGCTDINDLTGCSDAVFARNHDGQWSRISRLPQGRVAIAASAVVADSIYMFGGCTMPRKGDVVNQSEAWRFNTRTRQWKPLSPLPKAARGLSAIALDSRHILAAGGYTNAGFTSDAVIYNIDADRYESIEPLPLAVSNHALVELGPQILSIGGEDRQRSRTPRVFLAPRKY